MSLSYIISEIIARANWSKIADVKPILHIPAFGATIGSDPNGILPRSLISELATLLADI